MSPAPNDAHFTNWRVAKKVRQLKTPLHAEYSKEAGPDYVRQQEIERTVYLPSEEAARSLYLVLER